MLYRNLGLKIESGANFIEFFRIFDFIENTKKIMEIHGRADGRADDARTGGRTDGRLEFRPLPSTLLQSSA